MGRYINPDVPLSNEDIEFLRSRGREDEVIENERRFPPGGTPADHEVEGFMPKKPDYDYKTQAARTEDATGLPIAEVPVDENGNPKTPEYGYDDADDDGEDIDDDILEKVLEMDVDELKSELKKLGLKVSGNKDELIDRLAIGMQDKRDTENEEADKAQNKG